MARPHADPMLGRRAFLLALGVTPRLLALTEPSYGGVLHLRLPIGFNGLDPHLLDDLGSALFAPFAFDTLFAVDSRGQPFPALADGLPESEGRDARVTLRAGLKTALGKPLGAKDLVFALKRATRMGGVAWLSAFASVRLDSSRERSVLFEAAQPMPLAKALASPITAIIPRGFHRLRPDGTGAFRAKPSRNGLVLERNDNAARGAAFLDGVRAERVGNLSDSLRAFETGEADVGWLGKGLHQPRAHALGFDAGPLGWVVLHSGSLAGAWGHPGATGQLVSQLPPERLEHLGVRGMPHASAGSGWGGPPGEILVDGASPQLVELGTLVASLLSRPGHELRAVPRSRAELRAARGNRAFLLMVDFVRRISDDSDGVVAALYTAADPALARRPPKLRADARTVARALPLGVIGELHAFGAHADSFVGLSRWDLANSWLRPSPKPPSRS